MRETQTGFAERLGSWLDWTDAIALSAALGAETAAPPAPAQAGAASRSAAAAAAAANLEACRRVRSDLVKLATADVAYTAGAGGDGADDFSPYRRDYLAHQRAMESAIAPLRAQVRTALSQLTSAGARLAALDVVMEAALRPRERQLLATVPAWLEQQFDALRQVPSEAAPAESGDPSFHRRYHHAMQRVLLAELDLRLEPVEGLLEALQQASTP